MSESPEFPEPLERVIEAFELLPDWDERYRFIIELGRKLPPMPPGEQTPETKVHGCMSQVWLVAEVLPGPPPVVHFRADSDAHIVKGLIAILMSVFCDKPAAEVVTLDANAVLEQLGLVHHLSMGRRNGLQAMVKRIKDLAAAQVS